MNIRSEIRRKTLRKIMEIAVKRVNACEQENEGHLRNVACEQENEGHLRDVAWLLFTHNIEKYQIIIFQTKMKSFFRFFFAFNLKYRSFLVFSDQAVVTWYSLG